MKGLVARTICTSPVWGLVLAILWFAWPLKWWYTRPAERDPLGYKVEHLLKVKQADGTFREEKLVVKHSVHGPVVVEKGNKAIALRVAGLKNEQVCHRK